MHKKSLHPFLGLALAFGCQTEVPPELPSEYEFPEEEAAPTLSLAEIEAALPGALIESFQLDPRQILPVYEGFRSLGESPGNCPIYYNDPTYSAATWYTFEPCESDSGAIFDSNGCLIQSEFAEPGTYTDELGNIYQEHTMLLGSASIIDPQGTQFQFGGDIILDVLSAPGSDDLYTSFFIDGTFLWNGESAQSSWLQRQVSWGFMSAEAYDEVSSGTKSLYLSGGISGLTGTFNSVFFSTASIQTIDGQTCDLEPLGAVLVRDDAGYWYYIDYQGPEAAGSFSNECDGCGEVYLDNIYQGSVCADLSVFVDWQGHPWAGREQ